MPIAADCRLPTADCRRLPIADNLPMPRTFEQIELAAAFLRSQLPRPPRVAVVLGSGLGAFADALDRPTRIPYQRIPHWPASTVAGHAGELVVGTVDDLPAAALAGRVHLYEGHDAATVAFGVRVMARVGVRVLVLTCAAGGVNPANPVGSILCLDDHLNLTASNPLVGPNDERLGPRFPDMTRAWSPRLRTLANRAAAAIDLPLPHGVYAGLVGPNYETPAEIRMLRTLGADAVGMSTVVEAVAAAHAGMETLGLAVITNLAAGVLPQPLSHAEVLETGRRVQGRFCDLLFAILRAPDLVEPVPT